MRAVDELRGISPLFWLANMIVALAFAASFWLYGAFSGGLDAAETCTLRGQTWDREYRRFNLEEAGRYFPLHNKCNADYDLIPFWINPTVAFLTLLALAFAAACLVSVTLRLRRCRPAV